VKILVNPCNVTQRINSPEEYLKDSILEEGDEFDLIEVLIIVEKRYRVIGGKPVIVNTHFPAIN
jgi:hypothetical protein